MLSSFSMQRLGFRFKEFTRHHWKNAGTRAVWKPRIREASACISELEWRSVLAGIRACALRIVAPNELQALIGMLAPYDLNVVSLEKIAGGDGYGSSRAAPREGEPFNYWCAIGRVGDLQLMKSAQLNRDDEAIGRLLGYPPCCTDFYHRARAEEEFVDTTWPMAQNTTKKRSISPTHVEIPEVSWCNVLLKWIGIRIVFHLPCSFDCQPTVQMAAKFAGIARSAGFNQEMEWLEEMLGWPVEWTALNGLAEILTPVGTISTVTDATAETYRVTYKGGELSCQPTGRAFPKLGVTLRG